MQTSNTGFHSWKPVISLWPGLLTTEVCFPNLLAIAKFVVVFFVCYSAGFDFLFTVLLKMLMNELLSVVSVVMLVSMTESSFKNCWRLLLNLTSLTLPPNETLKVYTDPLAYVICCSWPHIGAKNTLVYTLYKYIGLPRCLQLVHLVLGTLTIVANAYPVQLYPQYWHSFSVKLELPVYALCV